MESNRTKHRLSGIRPRGRQSGITVIGLLLLLVVIGGIGLAVLKIVPLYLERMKIATVVQDVQTELGSGGNTVTSIRNALDSRFYIEAVTMDRSEIDITREGEGYSVHVHKELRTPFVADLWFLVVVDEEATISR